ncbi:hypothetical protein Pondi_00082 [Escherichia phage Pondi]|nr:hypothetical protein Pondi_00082 [Escherichia phage Pondi]
MSFFGSFLDTASSAFNWLGNNKAALDLISGAAKGYGAYMQYKQGNQQMKLMQKQQENEQRRWDDTHGVIDSYDNSIPPGQQANSALLSGSMADAMKQGAQ